MSVRPLTIGRQQLKILLKYFLKANGVRTIIFGVAELKKSSGRDGPVAGRRQGDVFRIGRLFFFYTKTPFNFKGHKLAQSPTQ
jgi:hypothetical protein